jgi:TRAP-type C4-dicarboxylate transport system substrate-binding protein
VVAALQSCFDPYRRNWKLKMLKGLVRLALIAFALAPATAVAEPIKLKLAFFTSDRISLYTDMIKPFVDAVNDEAPDQLQIEVYSSGVLGKSPAQQVQLVLDGVADIAFVIPGATDRFPDNAVVELPGLFRGLREASMVFTALVSAEMLSGYQDFVMIGAFATEPESIHTRRAIASLDDLRGAKIRISSPSESSAFEQLGMLPVLMPVTSVPDAISSGKIDGAAIAPALLQEFGIGRVASYHYLLRTSVGSLSLLMNRKKFESLPVSAQTIIRKYSGVWAAARFADGYEKLNRQAIEGLRLDPRRKVIMPSGPELDRAQLAFKSVTEEWASKSQHNRVLLEQVMAEIARLRSIN